jgi:DNA-binding CsgD family transcriptional regulator
MHNYNRDQTSEDGLRSPSADLLDVLDVALLVADESGVIVAANAAARQALGDSDELLGRPVSEVVGRADQHADHGPDPGPMAERLTRIEQTLRTALDEMAKVRRHSEDLAEVGPSLDMARLDRLSERERVIVRRLLGGYRVPSIASELFLSQSTIRNHLSSAFRKLGVRSQAELMALARADPSSSTVHEGAPPHATAHLRLAPTGTAAGR